MILTETLVLILALVLFFVGRGQTRALRRRIEALEKRLDAAGGAVAAPLATGPPGAVAEAGVAAITPPAEALETAGPPLAEQPATPPPEALPSPPPAVPQPMPPGRTLEERFGTRWTVWVGGLALALGGIFLVQYSIEQGLLGPGVRVFLGAVLAVVLVAGGEWTRRRETMAGLAALPAANVPSILTAAGTVVAFATVYVAYALYGFLSPGAAFLLLGVVAVATLAAALIHGPALAGLGMVAAYVTPLLVASDVPNYWALTLYLVVVTAASLALASSRRWLWLVIATIALDGAWSLFITGEGSAPIFAQMANPAAGFILVAAFVVAGLLFGPNAVKDRVDRVSSAALIAYLALAGVVVVATNHDGGMLLVFALLVGAAVAIAWRVDAATAAVPGAAIVVVLVILAWAFAADLPSGLAPGGPGAGPTLDPRLTSNGLALGFGAVMAVLFGWSGFAAQGCAERPLIPILWAATAAAAPPAILAAIYYRLTDLERSLPLAAVALILAALFAYATDRLARSAPRPGMAAAGAIFATGAVASLGLALTFALERAWLSVGFALMAPGIAYVYERRRLAILPWLAAAAAVAATLRALWEAPFAEELLGTAPIFNRLIIAYAVPALALWLGGVLLRRHANGRPAMVVDAAAILFTVVFVLLEIHHAMNGGRLTPGAIGLAELSLQVIAGLLLTIGLEWLRLRTGSAVHDVGALVVGGLTLAAIAGRLGVIQNPWLWPIDVGGPFFNLVLLGYGIPTLLLAALGVATRRTRPGWYRWIVAVTTVVLALLYLTLEVRRLFHDPVMANGPVFDGEQYTYSAVWLAFGVLILLAGVALRSQPVRLASAAVILLTVAKVFLIDLAGLTGVFRALSFIVLGLVLVAIGWLYQRLLFPRRPADTAQPQSGTPS